MSSAPDPAKEQNATLQAILATLKTVQAQQSQVFATVAALNARVDQLGIDDGSERRPSLTPKDAVFEKHRAPTSLPATPTGPSRPVSSMTGPGSADGDGDSPVKQKKTVSSSRIILTTYPGQSGIDPIPMDWGNADPALRGPVVVSRHQNTVRRRNGKSSAHPMFGHSLMMAFS